jgi:hypothetical protein
MTQESCVLMLKCPWDLKDEKVREAEGIFVLKRVFV